MANAQQSIDSIWKILTFFLLVVFAGGLFINLDNTAFWEDEGETVQLGKSILKFGYPSVFDGQSFFIQEHDRYNHNNFLRLTSPPLQFYLAAATLKMTGGIADTALMRFPFALSAFFGIFGAIIIFRQLRFSWFSLFIFILCVTTSVQLYLHYRQVRHYAIQFPFALLVVWSFLNLEKKWGQLLFIVSSILMYTTFYPAFFIIFISLSIHRVIEKIFYHTSFWQFVKLLLPILLFTVPQFLILRQYEQIPGNAYWRNVFAYLFDFNYFVYSKITVLSILFIVFFTFIKYKTQLSFSYISILWKNNRIVPLLILFLPIAIVLSSFGRHNARYISVYFPFSFLLLGWSWNKLIKWNYRLFSLPIFLYFMMVSHPKFFSEILLFKKELSSIYIGPIEVIVNTINNHPVGHIDEKYAKRPDLLIATNFEEHTLSAYLDSQFLSIYADGGYKYGNRPPDWIIYRAKWEPPFWNPEWNRDKYFHDLLSKGNYEMIETPYCDLLYEQTYLVRTHDFQTVTDCPDRKLVLYRLQNEK